MFNKKGQISIEMLIIISVLIVAAIIFATVYLSNLKNKTSGQEEMSKISEGFVSDSNQYIIPIINLDAVRINKNLEKFYFFK